jgi:hypothetical protein
MGGDDPKLGARSQLLRWANGRYVGVVLSLTSLGLTGCGLAGSAAPADGLTGAPGSNSTAAQVTAKPESAKSPSRASTGSTAHSPTASRSSPTPDPWGILDDQEAPISTMSFTGFNRWHGRAAGHEVNVYAGGEGDGRADQGMVVVDWNSRPARPALQILRPHGTGPLMAHRLDGHGRLLLIDSHGYEHRLLLAETRSSLGPRLGSPGVAAAPYALPTVGACAKSEARIARLRIEPDTPTPRCLQARPDQGLRFVNRSGDYGQPGHPLTIRLAGHRPVTLGVGESVTWSRPVGSYLAPGDHPVWISIYHGSGASIWLR